MVSDGAVSIGRCDGPAVRHGGLRCDGSVRRSLASEHVGPGPRLNHSHQPALDGNNNRLPLHGRGGILVRMAKGPHGARFGLARVVVSQAGSKRESWPDGAS